MFLVLFILDIWHYLDGHTPSEGVCKCVGIDVNSHVGDMCSAVAIALLLARVLPLMSTRLSWMLVAIDDGSDGLGGIP